MFAKDFKTYALVCAVCAAGSSHALAEDLPPESIAVSSAAVVAATTDTSNASNARYDGFNFFASANAQAVRQQGTDEAPRVQSAEEGASTSRTALAWLVGTLLLSTLMLSRNFNRRA